MAVRYDDDENCDLLHFSSGNSLYAHERIIGIAPDLSLSGGYDQRIYMDPMGNGDEELTAADAAELADHMIGLWVAFKASLEPGK